MCGALGPAPSGPLGMYDMEDGPPGSSYVNPAGGAAGRLRDFPPSTMVRGNQTNFGIKMHKHRAACSFPRPKQEKKTEDTNAVPSSRSLGANDRATYFCEQKKGNILIIMSSFTGRKNERRSILKKNQGFRLRLPHETLQTH